MLPYRPDKVLPILSTFNRRRSQISKQQPGVWCFWEICPGLNANVIQIPYDKHHEVSSLVKSHQNTYSSVKHEVI